MSRRDLLNAPCALLLLLALLSAGSAWAEVDNLVTAEGIHLDNTNEGGTGVGIEYDDDYDPAVAQDGASGYGDVDDMDMTSYAQGMDASSFGSTGTMMTDEGAAAGAEELAASEVASGVMPEPEEAAAQVDPADVEPEVDSKPKPFVPAPAAKVPASPAPPTPPAGAHRTLSSSDEEDTIMDDGGVDSNAGEGEGDDKLKEAEARKLALARRAAEEAEVKAAEAAEKLRRDTGAPLEKDTPKTIFEYYKPKVLEPVYVGGYWKRANPWDRGRRHDEGGH